VRAVLGHGLPSVESPARWSILAGPTVRPKGPTPSGGQFSTPDHTLRSISRLGFLSRPKEEQQAVALTQQLNIAHSSTQLVRTLSGGNQQKCVLGKWLIAKPRLFILDEPPRGIDVGAKAQIHRLIDQIADAGSASS
jgi:ABC-type sugar transport system ATPase subunit